MRPDAVIFDMDGTIIDNSEYHFLAWQHFYQKYNRSLTLEEYKTTINGRASQEILQQFFGKEMMREEITTYANEKNLLYRELYKPYIQPIAGVVNLMKEIHAAGIAVNIATSGTPTNVAFMFEHIPIQQYISHVVDASEVIHGKPDPEIFLKAAGYANAGYKKCIVFEDSIAGIAAANAAGMKVIGITTMHTKDELSATTNAVIDNYTQLTLAQLEALLD